MLHLASSHSWAKSSRCLQVSSIQGQYGPLVISFVQVVVPFSKRSAATLSDCVKAPKSSNFGPDLFGAFKYKCTDVVQFPKKMCNPPPLMNYVREVPHMSKYYVMPGLLRTNCCISYHLITSTTMRILEEIITYTIKQGLYKSCEVLIYI